MKILEICHWDRDGKILWKQENIPNIFHVGGQEFILKICFNTAAGLSIPSSYYLGMDNRTTPALADTLSSLSAEPTQNSYTRQAISSSNGFSVSLQSSGNYTATSSIATFQASGGSWGPVRNLFLATTSGSSGYLISTAALDGSRTLLDGQSLTVRANLGLPNC